MKKLLLYKLLLPAMMFCYLFNVETLSAQNLVLNPSFENVANAPYCFFQGVYNWHDTDALSDTCTTPDVFGSGFMLPPPLVMPNPFSSSPNAALGYQYSRTGSNHAGIIVYDTLPSPYREYLEGTLSAPLLAGKQYKVKFYINLAEIGSQYASNSIGVYFSNTLLQKNHCTTPGNFNVTPQLQYIGPILTDSVNWVPLEWTYIAQGGEQYITIGNFNSNANTTTTIVKQSADHPIAYYFIDDVEVTALNCSSIDIILSSTNDTLCPGSSNGSITIGNITGGVAPYQLQWQHNGSSAYTLTGLTDGYYTAIVTDAVGGCTYTETFQIYELESVIDSVYLDEAQCFNYVYLIEDTSSGRHAVNFIWNNGDSVNYLYNVPPAIYSVTITDNYGCIDNISVTISQVPGIYSEITAIPDTGGCSGSLTTLAYTGTLPFSYQWTGGQTTANINNLCAGTYNVTITDANGCTVYDSGVITNDSVLVWPGDANDDLIVDYTDIFPIGLYYGTNGFTRASVSYVWNGYSSANWPDTIYNGSNMKHADCNGDGIINVTDTFAISINYGETHTRSNTLNSRAGEPVFTLVSSQSVYLPGDTITLDIMIGDAGNQAADLYGVGFSINYDNVLAEPGSVEILITNSFLGTNADNLRLNKIFENNGKVDAAIVRKNLQPVSGYGKIGELKFKAVSNISTLLNTTVSFTDYSAIDENGDEILFDVQPVSFQIDGVTGIGSNVIAQFFIYPNPTNNQLNITTTLQGNDEVQYQIITTLGATAMANKATAKDFSIDVSTLPAGIYFIHLQSGNAQTVKRFVKE